MTGDSVWMPTAADIAAHLCDSAVVHDDRCTWLGTSQYEGDEGDLEFSYGTVGPDLYGGTAGISLFLAETAARTGSAICAERALQGIRQSIRTASIRPGPYLPGYFAGTTGIAYAAMRIARAIGAPGLAGDAAALMANCEAAEPARVDIISGAAGTIPALLTLSDWLPRPALRECAVALGDHLIAVARMHDNGAWSWRDADAEADEATVDLTGFSHGAAGIGWAFLELHAATGETRFRDAAKCAFRYERRWFRATEDNWPDFRGVESSGEPADCSVAWCHGAPGIGLSRLRVSQERGSPGRAETEAALRASIAWLERTARDPYADWSLCHGIAGVGDMLVQAGALLGVSAAREAAHAAARDAAERHRGSVGRWPCGVARGSNPSLMLGLAGIGYFFLRLADPSLPTALLPGARGDLRTADSTK